jgi:hypothetical protein
MIFVIFQEKEAHVGVNIKIKHEYDITFSNGFTQVLSRDEAHQLWVQLNKEFGTLTSKQESFFDQIKRENFPQNPSPVKFY